MSSSPIPSSDVPLVGLSNNCDPPAPDTILTPPTVVPESVQKDDVKGDVPRKYRGSAQHVYVKHELRSSHSTSTVILPECPALFVRVLCKSEYDAHLDECFRFARLEGKFIFVLPDEWTCVGVRANYTENSPDTLGNMPVIYGRIIVRTNKQDAQLYAYAFSCTISFAGGYIKHVTPSMLQTYTEQQRKEEKCQIM